MMEEVLLPEVAVKQESRLCSGCLSTDRRLTASRAHTDLFMYLLGQYAGLVSLDSVSLCWECSAVLKLVTRFQRQVQAAQATLMQTLNPEAENIHCLSTLVTTDIDILECLPPNIDSGQSFTFSMVSNYTLEIKKDEINPISMLDKENSQSDTSKGVKVSCKQEYPDYSVENVDSFEHYKNAAGRRKRLDSQSKSSQLKMKKSKMKFCEYLDVRRNPAIDLSACLQWFATSARDETEGSAGGGGVYRCKLCGSVADGADAGALRRHLQRHSRLYACTACRPHAPHAPPASLPPPLPPSFLSYRDFYYHYRSLHTKFICDHCGTVRRSKVKLSTHIRKFHDPEILKRKEAPELRYCVECNKEFRTVKAYRNHVSGSKLHNPHHQAHRKSDPSSRVCGNKNIRDRGNIIALHERGLKISEIARELKMTRGTVRHWVRRYTTDGSLADLPRKRPSWRRVSPDQRNTVRLWVSRHQRGAGLRDAPRAAPAPRALGPEQMKEMLRSVQRSPHTSTAALAARFRCSAQTVRTALRRAGCARFRKRRAPAPAQC